MQIASAASSAAPTDLSGHWAEKTVAEWLQKGWLEGYPDGTVKPDSSISRAEFITVVNRLMHFEETASMKYTDVHEEDWFYPSISRAVKAGYISGYDDSSMRPNQSLTRQETAVIAAKLAKLTNDDKSAEGFKDAGSFPAWSKGAIGAAQAKGLLNGYADGTFKPENSMTRAEAVVLLDRMMKASGSGETVYSEKGTYGPETGKQEVSGNVTVKGPGVKLQNMTIQGDLVFDEAIGEGDAFLQNVTVKGKTMVKGGGPNSIHFNHSNLGTVIVIKSNGTVRIVAEGTTSIDSLIVQSGVKLEESGLTGGGFTKVTLSDTIPPGTKVILIGSFDSVEVLGKGITMELAGGSIAQLSVASSAADTTLSLAKDTKVSNMTLNSAVKTIGQGKIEKATMNEAAQKSVFETQPGTIVNTGSSGPGYYPGNSGGTTPTPGKAKTSMPTVTGTVYENDKLIVGQAEFNAQVTVVRKETSIGSAAANANGSFSIAIQEGQTLTAGDSLEIRATAPDKTVSDPLTVTVAATPQMLKAIGVKKLQMTVPEAIPAGTKIQLNVTRGPYGVPANVYGYTVEANRVTLTLEERFIEGDYTVNLSGLSQPYEAKVFVEYEQRTLRFLWDTAVLDANDPKTVETKVLITNQYNEDVTRNYLGTFLYSSTSGSVSIKNRDTIIIHSAVDFIMGNLITVTAMGDEGKFVSTILRVDTQGIPAAPKPVDPEPPHEKTITIHGIYHPENKELNESSTEGDFYILITAKDSTGKLITPEEAAQTFICSMDNTLIARFSTSPEFNTNFQKITVDGVEYLAIPLKYGYQQKFTAGKATFYIISKYTGEKATFTIEVKEIPKASKFVFSKVAAIPGGDIEVPYQALDQLGKPLSTFSISDVIAANADKGRVTFKTDTIGQAPQLIVNTSGITVSEAETLTFYLVTKSGVSTGVVTLIPYEGYVIPEKPVVPRLINFTILEPDIVIAGEINEIPFSATDAKGNPVTDIELLNQGIKKLAFAGPFGGGMYFSHSQADGSVKLFLDLTTVSIFQPASVYLLGTLTDDFVVARGVKVYPNAAPAVIGGIINFMDAYLTRSSIKINSDRILVYDQYNRKSTARDWTAKGYSFGIKSDNDDVIEYTSMDRIDSNHAFWQANTKAPGTARIRVYVMREVIHGAGIDGSTYGINVRVVAPEQVASYEVADMGTMYANPNGMTNSYYGKTVNVTGFLQDGSRVTIPKSNYQATVTGSTYFTYSVSEGKLYLYVNPGIDLGGANKEKSFPLTVSIPVNGKIIELTQTFVVSNVPPIPVSIQLRNVLASNSGYKVRVEGSNSVSVPYNEFLLMSPASLADMAIKVTDQYGAEIKTNKFTSAPDYTFKNGGNWNNLQVGDSFILKANASDALGITMQVTLR